MTSSAASDSAEIDGDQDIKITAWTLEKEAFKRINVSWEGDAVLYVRTNSMYVGRDCGGMCKDEVNIFAAMLLVLDGVKNNTPSFYDVKDEVSYNELPVTGGRGIVISPDITKPMVTDNCVVVCCRNIAVYLMKYRVEHANNQTMNRASSLVPKPSGNFSNAHLILADE